MEAENSRIVGVILERRPARSRWVDHVWRAVEVLDGEAQAEPFTKLAVLDDGTERYFAGNIELVLHRSDTEAYQTNLSGNGVLYVVLRPDETHAHPFSLHKVTASPHESCDLLDSSEDFVEAVPMPPLILAWLQAFVTRHHKEKPFVKRQRERVDQAKLNFSREPIFARKGRAVAEPDESDG